MKKFSYLSKMRDKEKKAPFSSAYKDLHKPIERVQIPLPIKCKNIGSTLGVCCPSPFTSDISGTVTAVSQDDIFNEYKYLVGVALSASIAVFLEKKLKDNPDALLRLYEHFKQANNEHKSKKRKVK